MMKVLGWEKLEYSEKKFHWVAIHSCYYQISSTKDETFKRRLASVDILQDVRMVSKDVRICLGARPAFREVCWDMGKHDDVVLFHENMILMSTTGIHVEAVCQMTQLCILGRHTCLWK